MLHLVYPLHPRYNPEAANHRSQHTRDCPPQPPCNPALRKRGRQIWYFPTFHWFLFVLNTPLQLGSWLQSNQDFTEHMLSVTISKSRLYLLYFKKEFFIVTSTKRCEQCSLTVQNLTAWSKHWTRSSSFQVRLKLTILQCSQCRPLFAWKLLILRRV